MRRFVLLIPIALGLAGLTGCEAIQGLIGGAVDGKELVKDAERMLEEGDLPGAAAEFERLAESHKDVLEVAQGRAYVALLQGDYDAADDALALVDSEEKAKDKVGEVRLRRAIVALHAGNQEKVQSFGKASGTAVGKLLAAEVHLRDAERSEASELLTEASEAGGSVGKAADAYLELIRKESEDPVWPELADANASWALAGRDAEARNVAVDIAQQALEALPADAEGRDTLLLLWAGRAVTSGNADSAESLLDQIDTPPDGQSWRISATRAMVMVSRGRAEEAVGTFSILNEGGAPADGLFDALATAASLAKDKEVAKQLAGALESNAAARGLFQAGAQGAAKKAAPDGIYRTFLENM